MNGWLSEYVQMIVDCQDREDKLSDWERGFIDSIERQISAKGTLTTKQAEIVDKIWERVTS